MNNVVLVGRLTKDPELKYLTSGTAVATFTLAINRDYKNKDGSTPVDFVPVEIMGKPAEFVANYITKGRLVGVQGSIRVDRYDTPDGEKRTFTKVSGRSIQALESKSKATKDETPPQSPTEFTAVDDDDVPF